MSDIDTQKFHASRLDLNTIDVEAWLSKAMSDADALPDSLLEKAAILKSIVFIRHSLESGDEENAKLFMVKVRDLFNSTANKHRDLLVDVAIGYKNDQAEKGKKGAEARWSQDEARAAVGRMIESLAARRDGLGDWLPPSALWPELFSAMDAAGLAPDEQGNAYTYSGDGLVTYEAFRKKIQRTRE